MMTIRHRSGVPRITWIGCGFGIGVLGAIAVGWSSEPEAQGKVDYRGTLLVQLRVSDLDRAVEFYTMVLNFELVNRIDSLKWAELSFGIPNVMVGLGEAEEVQGSGTVSLNIGVKDVDRTRELLEQRGVTFLGPTIEIPGKVKLADFLDRDRNKIRLAQRIAG